MGYFKNNPPHELWRKLKCRFFVLFNSYAFGAFGKHNFLFNPQLLNPQNIFLGSNLWISDKTWLATSKKGKLSIGNRVRIGRFSEIYALCSIIIEDGVEMAENTYISDNTHTCIMGWRIGKNCVIGAYSFIKKDIPDYCVVVGNPARIVKRFNPQSNRWEKTDKDGNFINE